MINVRLSLKHRIKVEMKLIANKVNDDLLVDTVHYSLIVKLPTLFIYFTIEFVHFVLSLEIHLL